MGELRARGQVPPQALSTSQETHILFHPEGSSPNSRGGGLGGLVGVGAGDSSYDYILVHTNPHPFWYQNLTSTIFR